MVNQKKAPVQPKLIYKVVGIFFGIILGAIIVYFISNSGFITSPHSGNSNSNVQELEAATVGVPYAIDFTSSLIPLLPQESTGGPYTFYLGSGVGFPPMGIILGIDGVLRGTPTAAGNNKFQVCVKDVGGKSACKTYSLIVNPASEVLNAMPVRGQITDKDTGKLVEGAIIKVAYNEGGTDKSVVVYSSGSPVDSNGNNYLMYLPYYLPENVIISVNSAGYLPASKNTGIDASLEQEGKHRLVNFVLIPISEKVIVIDNQLHHLGDDYYSGSLNSQFQMSAEGLQYSKSFTIDEKQLKYSTAYLKITNKGAGLSNQIILNGQNIGTLCCSPSDGSFGTLQWKVDMGILKEGSNQITINSAINPDDSSDHDDFEFTDMMIELQL